LSCGPDNIPGLLLKHVKDEIIPIMTRIINSSIQSGIFPSELNIGQIIPVSKSGSKALLENYHPICITSMPGKVVEMVVRNKFNDHLETILPHNMYRFCNAKSTQDAIVDLTMNN